MKSKMPEIEGSGVILFGSELQKLVHSKVQNQSFLMEKWSQMIFSRVLLVIVTILLYFLPLRRTLIGSNQCLRATVRMIKGSLSSTGIKMDYQWKSFWMITSHVKQMDIITKVVHAFLDPTIMHFGL